jgi:hypothetical protein
MTLSRDLNETEYLVALVAGQHAAAQVTMAPSALQPPDVALAVGTAERICEEIIQRKDNPNPPAPLPPGVIHIDEFSSQFNDGSGKVAGIGIEWFRSDELGPNGNTLSPDQVRSLMGAIIRTVEEWVESEDGAPGIQVLFDAD